MDTNQEQQYEDELNQSRVNADNPEESVQKSEASGFPFGMLIIAGFFDLIGLIPFLNILTDLLAAFIFWFWQKSYIPSFDPLLNIFANKVIDVCTLGIFPSNIGIVIVAYIKKRAASKENPSESPSSAPEPSAA